MKSCASGCLYQASTCGTSRGTLFVRDGALKSSVMLRPAKNVCMYVCMYVCIMLNRIGQMSHGRGYICMYVAFK